MENGIKALFIASGILIALATVSLAVNIFIKNQIVIEDGSTKVDFATIAYHNSQFTPYEKDNLTYANVMSLIGVVVENNLRQVDENYMITMALPQYESKTGGIYKITNKIDKITPKNNSFINDNKYVYLNANSVYRGKVFKATLMYNDMGIIDKVQIEIIN